MQESSEFTDRGHSHVPAYMVEIRESLATLKTTQKDLKTDTERRLQRLEACVMWWGAFIGTTGMGLIVWLATEFVAGLRGL